MAGAFDLMDGILTGLVDCADLCGEYEALVSIGRPIDPVGSTCNTISIWKRWEKPLDMSRRRSCQQYWKEEYGIRLIQCCGEIDTQVNINLNSGFEEKFVKCFLADAEAVKCCLVENLQTILTSLGDIRCDEENPITDIKFDQSLQGQCYGVDFTFEAIRGECCEPEV